jgi:hypothetical protein
VDEARTCSSTCEASKLQDGPQGLDVLDDDRMRELKIVPTADTPTPAAGDRSKKKERLLLEVVRDADGTLRVRTTKGGDKESDPAVGVLADELQEVADAFGRAVTDMDEEGRLRRSLPSDRMRPVTRALSHVVDVLFGSALDRNVTAEELSTRLQVTTDAVDVVLHGGPKELDALIVGLVPVSPESEADPERAEARGRLRLQALYRKIIRDAYTVRELSAMRLSRQRLQQLRAADRLFAVAVPHHKGLLHPRWQFDRDGRPRPEMPDLIAAAREAGFDAIAFHQLMLNPDAADEGAPVDLLDTGRVEEVLDIIRARGA